MQAHKLFRTLGYAGLMLPDLFTHVTLDSLASHLKSLAGNLNSTCRVAACDDESKEASWAEPVLPQN